MTIKASPPGPAMEPGMAEGLRILARIIATAHRRRMAEADGNQGQPKSGRSRKAKRDENSEHKR